MKKLFLLILVIAGSMPAFAEEPAKASPPPNTAASSPAPAAKPKPPGNISVKAEVNRASITIGDPVIYTVTIKHGPELQILSSIPPPAEGILKIKKVEEFKTKEGKNIIEGRKFTLTTFRLGDFILDPVSIQYRSGGDEVQTIETDRIYITVKSVAEGETKADIRGLKSILAIPAKVLFFIFIIAGLVAAIAALFAYRRFVRKPGEEKPAGPVLTPAEEALFNLNQLFDSDLLRRGKIKEYYLRLSEILRMYFEKRFQILAVEYTTDEIMRALRDKGIERELREKIQEVLEAADLAKFAKWKPEPPEIIQINQKSKAIIEISKPAETASPEVPRGV
jgi:hypothetical protein